MRNIKREELVRRYAPEFYRNAYAPPAREHYTPADTTRITGPKVSPPRG